jgi:hypothetical protein
MKEIALPESEPGYRYLNKDEIVLKGDECRSTYSVGKNYGHWDACSLSIGTKVGNIKYNYLTFRRKVEEKPAKKRIRPGKRYRLLKLGETIEINDQFWSTINQRWENTTFDGETVSKYSDKYRRKVEVKAPVVVPTPEPAVKPNLAPNGVDLGIGYRLVLEHEYLEKGDETWQNYRSTWAKCGTFSFSKTAGDYPHETIRRKVDPKPVDVAPQKKAIGPSGVSASTAIFVYEELKRLLGLKIEENMVLLGVEQLVEAHKHLVDENKTLKEKLAKALEILKA